MSLEIHKSAMVSDKAKIADGVKIGAYAIIEDNVTLGEGTTVGEFSIIKENTTIGKNNIIHSHVVIGDLPQDIGFDRSKKTFVSIGDNNEFREFVNIHRASATDGTTIIGNNCYFMATAHVAHDCKIADNVILCNGALVAGYVEIGTKAFVSGNVVIHQNCLVGSYVMLGGGSSVIQDVLPYTLTAPSEHAEAYKINIVGLRRAGFSSDDIKQAELAHDMWYDWNSTKQEFLDKYLNNNDISKVVKNVVEFIEKSKRGIVKRHSK